MSEILTPKQMWDAIEPLLPYGSQSEKYDAIARKTLEVMTPKIQKAERDRVIEWGRQRCVIHHTRMKNVLHRTCNECWQSLGVSNEQLPG